jgi:hypothetical protein
LERALSTKDRAKLGAHFTPRAYVERLVVITVIEPLREEWNAAQAAMDEARSKGRLDEARQIAADFHHRLATVRVLDPACGTGNFLYVTLELMKRLEGEVLDALAGLGEDTARLGFQGETVDPHQFLGLELNPRAAAISELVLWIGYLQWNLRTLGGAAPSDPVLKAYGNIEVADALLSYDLLPPIRLANGELKTRWDGETKAVHPVTGKRCQTSQPKYWSIDTSTRVRAGGLRQILLSATPRSSASASCATDLATSIETPYSPRIPTFPAQLTL